MPPPITGGCACGAIRYEASAEPLLMFNCHCEDCRHASGGAFVSALSLRPSSPHFGAPIEDLQTFWDIPLRTDPFTSAQGFGIGFAWTLVPGRAPPV